MFSAVLRSDVAIQVSINIMMICRDEAIFCNTHEVIVEEVVFEQVLELRENKLRFLKPLLMVRYKSNIEDGTA